MDGLVNNSNGMRRENEGNEKTHVMMWNVENYTFLLDYI